jgi:hypothetical protein
MAIGRAVMLLLILLLLVDPMWRVCAGVTREVNPIVVDLCTGTVTGVGGWVDR